MKTHKLGTKITEIVCIIFSVMSFVLFFIFTFSQWSEQMAYKNNKKLPYAGDLEAPYDYWPLMRYCIVVFILCLIGIVICEISTNIYEMSKKLAKNDIANVKKNVQTPASQPQPQAIQPQQEASAAQPEPTPSYVCPNCGKQNKITDRFCDACGLPNPNTQK